MLFRHLISYFVLALRALLSVLPISLRPPSVQLWPQLMSGSFSEILVSEMKVGVWLSLSLSLSTVFFLCSVDGFTWRNASSKPEYYDPVIDYISVACPAEDICFAMGRREKGFEWQTIILASYVPQPQPQSEP